MTLLGLSESLTAGSPSASTTLQTNVQLRVSGKSRELVLGMALPPGFVPVRSNRSWTAFERCGI